MGLAAKAMKISQSKRISSLIEKLIEWSESTKKLAGAWGDFPSLDEIKDIQKKILFVRSCSVFTGYKYTNLLL